MAGIAEHHWEHVAVRHDGGVTELRLHSDNGPLRWNAAIHRELVEAFAALGVDAATRAVVLTGTGDSFCTSIDVDSFRGSTNGWDVTWWEGRRMLTGLVDIDVPVITAVNGPVPSTPSSP